MFKGGGGGGRCFVNGSFNDRFDSEAIVRDDNENVYKTRDDDLIVIKIVDSFFGVI